MRRKPVRREQYIGIRCTDDERSMIERTADAARQTMTDCIVAAVRAYGKRSIDGERSNNGNRNNNPRSNKTESPTT